MTRSADTRRIFITGATGYLGARLIPLLLVLVVVVLLPAYRLLERIPGTNEGATILGVGDDS